MIKLFAFGVFNMSDGFKFFEFIIGFKKIIFQLIVFFVFPFNFAFKFSYFVAEIFCSGFIISSFIHHYGLKFFIFIEHGFHGAVMVSQSGVFIFHFRFKFFDFLGQFFRGVYFMIGIFVGKVSNLHSEF